MLCFGEILWKAFRSNDLIPNIFLPIYLFYFVCLFLKLKVPSFPSDKSVVNVLDKRKKSLLRLLPCHLIPNLLTEVHFVSSSVLGNVRVVHRRASGKENKTAPTSTSSNDKKIIKGSNINISKQTNRNKTEKETPIVGSNYTFWKWLLAVLYTQQFSAQFDVLCFNDGWEDKRSCLNTLRSVAQALYFDKSFRRIEFPSVLLH